jgi:hypothetical protein
MKHSKITKQIDDHDLVNTCVKITPFLARIFSRCSSEKGANVNNRVSIAHGIRLAGVALAKRYGVSDVEKLSVNYQ